MPGQGHREELTSAEGPAYDVWLNDVAYWHHVLAAVWDYTLGGYPVLKKWLSYRERRVLGRDFMPQDVRAFSAIARRIAAILGMQAGLDGSYRGVKGEA
jgi:hypothetical protein